MCRGALDEIHSIVIVPRYCHTRRTRKPERRKEGEREEMNEREREREREKERERQ